MPTMDLITEYVIRYGFQVLGAVLVFAIGAVVARWAGTLVQRWLERHDMEPPVRMLFVKITQVLILVFTAMAALGQLGVQIAPLLAGIGVAGLGVGLALQGVLSNVIAGLSIIFTKPYRVGEHISILGVEGDVLTIDLFSTTLVHPDRSRVVIPNRKIVGEILHNFSQSASRNSRIRALRFRSIPGFPSRNMAASKGHSTKRWSNVFTRPTFRSRIPSVKYACSPRHKRLSLCYGA
jgi:small conductance mechanosensitive channel